MEVLFFLFFLLSSHNLVSSPFSDAPPPATFQEILTCNGNAGLQSLAFPVLCKFFPDVWAASRLWLSCV